MTTLNQPKEQDRSRSLTKEREENNYNKEKQAQDSQGDKSNDHIHQRHLSEMLHSRSLSLDLRMIEAMKVKEECSIETKWAKVEQIAIKNQGPPQQVLRRRAWLVHSLRSLTLSPLSSPQPQAFCSYNVSSKASHQVFTDIICMLKYP